VGTLTIWPVGLQIQSSPDPKSGEMRGAAVGSGSNALATKGIVLNVEIGVDLATADLLRALGQPVPSPITCNALVDTGASVLAIDQSIAQKLNLARRGINTTHTANGPRQCDLYAVSLAFPATTLGSFNILQAIEVNLSTQPFKCLIGREVLSKWHVHYNGESGVISIAD
jgi:predicted aspartyl protease